MKCPRRRGQASTFELPELAATLRKIATEGPAGFYEGAVARAICEASWLDEDDLVSYRAGWVEPLRIAYGDHEVAELPAPTQGVAAAEALGLLAGCAPDLPNQIACARLALEDAREHVRDGAEVSHLLDPAHLERRRRDLPAPVAEPSGATVYLCAVDGDGMALSLIQSLYRCRAAHAPRQATLRPERDAGLTAWVRRVPRPAPSRTACGSRRHARLCRDSS